MTSVDDARDRLLAREQETAEAGPFTPDWDALQNKTTPDWYQDAKFGIFIHWTASSVPAFGTEWYPRNMYIEGTPEFEHHVATYGTQDAFGYKDFIPKFTGANFDADEWIELVRDAGARYVVPVAEHHDGFAMYDSDLTTWKSTSHGPGRDVIGELAAAAREQGMKFGLSYHRAENWWFYNGGTRFESDVRVPENSALYGRAQPIDRQPDETFLDEWSARIVELVEKYDPTLIWFDWWVEQPAFEPRLREFASYYYNHGDAKPEEPVIVYKWEAFAPGSAVYAVERGSVRTVQTSFFQNDTSASRVAWAYLTENDFKSAPEIVGELIDVVSKNGALLLNIGPGPDGTITHQEKALLREVGRWLRVNGEAIYSTRPWLVFGEGPTVQALGSFSDTAPTEWTAEDVRYTSREHDVYASFFVWPGKSAVLRSFSSLLRIHDGTVTSVSVLGHGPVPWTIDGLGLRVEFPDSRPDTISPVVKIELTPNAPVARHEPDFAQ
jgi:alpha-L-fucosidase